MLGPFEIMSKIFSKDVHRPFFLTDRLIMKIRLNEGRKFHNEILIPRRIILVLKYREKKKNLTPKNIFNSFTGLSTFIDKFQFLSFRHLTLLHYQLLQLQFHANQPLQLHLFSNENEN